VLDDHEKCWMILLSAGANKSGFVAPVQTQTAAMLARWREFRTIHQASIRRLEFSKLVVPLILKHYAWVPVSAPAIAATTEPWMIARVIFVSGNARGGCEGEHRNGKLREFNAIGFDSERTSWYFRVWRQYRGTLFVRIEASSFGT
jgi:hypothetical protein